MHCCRRAALFLPLLLPTLASAGADDRRLQEPIAFGMLSGNSSCVIFAEGRKTSGHFYGVAVSTRTLGKLTLVEAQNYAAAPKEVIETQENLDALMQTAQKDHVKFVKIPEKYSPELLGKARTACTAAPSE